MNPEKDDKKCCAQEEANREGTSLLTRFLPALDPANAPIDPRSAQDILVFAKRYADLVRYYDVNDEIDWVDFESGIITKPCTDEPAPQVQKQQQQSLAVIKQKKQIITWKEFFYNDIAVVVASIAQWKGKLQAIRKEYNDIRKRVENEPEKEILRDLFLSIIHHLKRIHRWYERSEDNHPLKTDLQVQIQSFLAPALEKLMGYDKGMMLNNLDDLDLVTQYETFKTLPWDKEFAEINADDSVYVGDNLKKKIIYSLMYVDDVFNTMYKVYEELTRRSDYYWQQAIEKFPTHQPHMALFISFVELFSFASKELNNLTKRHLEFFYRDVLHLEEKPARPDSVYLIYQLAKGVDEFDLKQGTDLSAGKDGLGKAMVYKTDKELVINKAKVKELKTLFLDIGSIKNIYAAPVANSADGKGEKFKDPETAWSTFGYFEPRQPGDKLTGEEAKTGFAIACPQFLLSGGERMIEITIRFSKATTNAIGKSKKFDNKSVHVFFSGKEEWIQPEIQSALEDDNKDDASKQLYSAATEARILSFINTAASPEDIAGVERQAGPVFDNPMTKKGVAPKQDYDIGIKLATQLYNRVNVAKKPFESLQDLLDEPGLGDDKISDLLYTFSNQYIAWNNGTRELIVKASVHTSQEAIVPFNKEKLKENYNVDTPLCKILFDPGSGLYELFRNAIIDEVELFVKVDGLTNLVIQTDDGPADPKKKVFPLSAAPQVGSSFSVGSTEFINKKLNGLALKAEWVGDLEFEERYKLYSQTRTEPNRYTCDTEIYYDNQWNVVNDQPVQLFDTKNKKLQSKNLIIRVPDGGQIRKAQAVPENNAQIVRFTLNAPDFGHEEYPALVAYQLANRLNEEGNPVDGQQGKKADLTKIYVPKAPMSPAAKLFTVNYSATEFLDTTNSRFFHIYPFGETEIYPDLQIQNGALDHTFDVLLDVEEETKQLIIPTKYLLPQFKYGSQPPKLKMIKAVNELVSNKYDDFKKKQYFHLNQYESATDQQGNLFIGIEDLVPPQNLSLLFKFADGTAYDNDSEPPKINWSYLVNNEWIQMPQDHIITDSTYGFQTTGIILFDFPADATKNNTLLNPDLYWLCASIDLGANKVPKLIDVIAQANQATFYDQDNDPKHYEVPLPENTISKPVVKIPQVKLIQQPFESFDGKPKEYGRQFYQRVSERLHHKNRAITPSDYEHMCLEQFPSVYKVKVLSHTDPECLCRHKNPVPQKDDCCCEQVSPGHVLIIPVSNLRNKNAIDKLKPRTGRRTLLKIEEYFRKRVSPFVHVHAKNPTFEEVKVSFNVKFYTGIDKGFYLKKLNEDIIRHLTPWAYDSNVEVLFGNKIYASKVINAIEDFDYVDYITCFRMIHIAQGCCESDTLKDMECDEMQIELDPDELTPGEIKYYQDRFLNEVSAKSSRSILVSAKQHCISIIEDEPEEGECNCKPAGAKSSVKKTK